MYILVCKAPEGSMTGIRELEGQGSITSESWRGDSGRLEVRKLDD